MDMHFSDLLEFYLEKKGQTSAKISAISGIPKTTVNTWLNGGTRYPRNWQHILQICRGLDLSEIEANQLLEAARHQTIATYRDLAVHDGDDRLRELIAFWPLQAESDVQAPFLAPSRRTDKLFGRQALIDLVRKTLHSQKTLCVIWDARCR